MADPNPPAPDPAARAALDAFKKKLLDGIDAGEDRHWQLGRDYNQLVADGTAQKAGYATTHAFVEKELGNVTSQSSLTRDGDVAAAFTEPVAIRYHVAKLAMLIAIARAANLALPSNGGDPGEVLIPLGGGKNLKFNDCKMGDLNRAWAALEPTPVALPAAEKRAAELQAAVEQKLGKQSHVRVSARSQGGRIVIDVAGLPADPPSDATAVLTILSQA